MNRHNSTIKIKPCKHCGQYHDFGRCRVKKQRKRIWHESKKRAKERPIYNEEKAQFLHLNKFCQVRSIKCTGKSEQIHHSKGRHGKFYLDKSTWIATCPTCHQFIEHDADGIRWAREKGLVKKRI